MNVNPLTRLSSHFILADFLGNDSVYRKGIPNAMRDDAAAELKLANVRALCTHVLEPLMAAYGAFSISYGYIAPDTSRALVRYQDPDKPSHHRFDLGAAADVCVHEWVRRTRQHLDDLFLPESAQGAPIALAHGVDMLGDIPYSRIITYSESPYICVAASAREIAAGKPRRAFYENRFEGQPKVKPAYTSLSTPQARQRHFERLQENGLPAHWEGAGFPTYHGGGRKQYHHIRVSNYTMVSDWLVDLQSIAEGHANAPELASHAVQDSFAAAGIVYDLIRASSGIPRLSITAGYYNPENPNFTRHNDWRTRHIHITLLAEDMTWVGALPEGVSLHSEGAEGATLRIDVDAVLSSPIWHDEALG